MGHVGHWLVANGLWKDLLAAVIALAVTRVAAWRPLRRLRRIEDLLDTDSPGGLRDVVRALRGEDDGSGDEDDVDAGGHGAGHHEHPADTPPPAPLHHIR